MDKLITHSHDSLFKLFMQDKQFALEVIDSCLPLNIKPFCDLASLKIESGSFIEPDLKPRANDILYSVNTTKGKGYIYFLIEHQSKPDNMIAFRLMRYAMMAMENHLKQGRKKLPLVVPILFYAGEKPHPKSTPLNWLNHFDMPEIAKKIYSQPFILVDINEVTDDTMTNHKRFGMLTYLLKHIRTRDLLLMVKDIAEFLVSGLLTPAQQKSVLIYIFNQGKIDTSQTQTFIDILNEHTQLHGGDTMATTTIAQYLEQRGLEQGLQQGLHDATLNIAKNMLINGADFQLVQKSTGLSDDEIKKLMNHTN